MHAISECKKGIQRPRTRYISFVKIEGLRDRGFTLRLQPGWSWLVLETWSMVMSGWARWRRILEPIPHMLSASIVGMLWSLVALPAQDQLPRLAQHARLMRTGAISIGSQTVSFMAPGEEGFDVVNRGTWRDLPFLKSLMRSSPVSGQ